MDPASGNATAALLPLPGGVSGEATSLAVNEYDKAVVTGAFTTANGIDHAVLRLQNW